MIMLENHKALNQKGFIPQLLVVILLLAGIVAGYFLLQNTQIFKSKATNPPIVAKTVTGLPLPVSSAGIVEIQNPTVKLELTSPLGPARPSPAPSVSPLPSVQVSPSPGS